MESVFDTLKARWVAESETDLRMGYLELVATSSLAKAQSEATVELLCEHSNDSVSWSCSFNGCYVMASYGPAQWLLADETNLVPAGVRKLAAGKSSSPGDGAVETALTYLKLSKSLLQRACPNKRCSPEANICKKEIAQLLKLDEKSWSLGQVTPKAVRISRGSYDLPGGIADLKAGAETRARFACNRGPEAPEIGCLLILSAPGCRWAYSIDAVHQFEDGQLGEDGAIWESQNLSISGSALSTHPGP